MAEEDGHPILTGLTALIGVGLVVGLLVSMGALAATSVLGLDGDGGGGQADGEQSMYLPTPSPTAPYTGPLVTLQPGQQQPSEAPRSKPKKPKEGITLSAGQSDVASMERIDLMGTYPGGEGAVLQVQRFEDGQWVDFPVDASVSNQTFSTYIMTGRSGTNRFRVVDTQSGKASNEIKVQVR